MLYEDLVLVIGLSNSESGLLFMEVAGQLRRGGTYQPVAELVNGLKSAPPGAAGVFAGWIGEAVMGGAGDAAHRSRG